jgi:hypothetical protein
VRQDGYLQAGSRHAVLAEEEEEEEEEAESVLLYPRAAQGMTLARGLERGQINIYHHHGCISTASRENSHRSFLSSRHIFSFIFLSDSKRGKRQGVAVYH